MENKADQLPTAPLIERFQGGIRANADPRMLAERMLRASELALEAARRDTADAMLACEELSERILALEAELELARQEPERLEGLLTAERRGRRLAEQHAYAEQARREELQEELAAAREAEQTDPAVDDPAETEARRRELESEAAALRRRADELAHLVGSAQRARERSERRVAELTVALTEARRRGSETGPGLRLGSPASDALGDEFAVAAKPVPPSRPVEAASPPGSDSELELERRLVRARTGAPAAPAAAAEARAARLERELAEQISRSSRAYDAIEELRTRLGAIGGWGAGPSAPEPTDASDSAPPAPSITSQAAQSAPSVASEAAPPAPPAPAGVVEPERFNAALTRLREAAPADARTPDAAVPPEPDASSREARPVTPVAWLPGVLRRLARENPVAAGQLVLELLPAQRAVHPVPIAYDLELPGQTCIQMTVTETGMKLQLGERRPPSEVRFAVSGDPASLARMLAAGRIGRRLRRGLPRVSGDREGLQALDALIRAPLGLRQLHEAGVRLEPRLALEVAARMIEPGWSRGSRFAIGYRGPGEERVVYLDVSDGDGARVSDAAAPELVAGTITAEAESLLTLLDGREPGTEEFEGEPAQLAKVIGWVKRAQSA